MSYFPWILPSIIASLICILLSLLIWKRRRLPVAKAIYLMLATVFIWAFMQLMILFVDGYFWKIVLSKVQYLGIVYTPVSWFIFVFSAFNQTKIINKRVIIYVLIVPTITLLLAFTNEFHGLIWSQVELSTDGFQSIVVSHGKWFRLHTVYSYLLVASTTIYAILESFKSSTNRTKSYVIVIAPVVVISTNIIYLLKWIDFKNMDLTPMGFSFALILFTWVIFRDHLLQLLPVARSTLFEEMGDALIVLDEYLRVVDINPAARNLFTSETSGLIGRSLKDIVGMETVVSEVLDNRSAELKIYNKELQTLRTVLSIDKNHAKGYLIVFRDITELKNTQNNLIAARKELKKANQSLQHFANTDVLTNLPNRRHFFEKFSFEIERANRLGSDLCLLIMDLDYFKNVNDNHGHPAGDKVLMRVAMIITKIVRVVDIPGRIGGEEFCVLLTDTNLSGGKIFAERLRSLIEHGYEEGDIPITASMGLATYQLNDTTEVLYDKADKALYQSKESGRNKITVFGD